MISGGRLGSIGNIYCLLDDPIEPWPIGQQRFPTGHIQTRPRLAIEQCKAVLVEDVDHGLIGKIPTWARIMHAGNGDRQRLPQPIDRMKGRLVLTELNSMKDVEKKRQADQQDKANTA